MAKETIIEPLELVGYEESEDSIKTESINN